MMVLALGLVAFVLDVCMVKTLLKHDEVPRPLAFLAAACLLLPILLSSALLAMLARQRSRHLLDMFELSRSPLTHSLIFVTSFANLEVLTLVPWRERRHCGLPNSQVLYFTVSQAMALDVPQLGLQAYALSVLASEWGEADPASYVLCLLSIAFGALSFACRGLRVACIMTCIRPVVYPPSLVRQRSSEVIDSFPTTVRRYRRDGSGNQASPPAPLARSNLAVRVSAVRMSGAPEEVPSPPASKPSTLTSRVHSDMPWMAQLPQLLGLAPQHPIPPVESSTAPSAPAGDPDAKTPLPLREVAERDVDEPSVANARESGPRTTHPALARARRAQVSRANSAVQRISLAGLAATDGPWMTDPMTSGAARADQADSPGLVCSLQRTESLSSSSSSGSGGTSDRTSGSGGTVVTFEEHGGSPPLYGALAGSEGARRRQRTRSPRRKSSAERQGPRTSSFGRFAMRQSKGGGPPAVPLAGELLPMPTIPKAPFSPSGTLAQVALQGADSKEAMLDRMEQLVRGAQLTRHSTSSTPASPRGPPTSTTPAGEGAGRTGAAAVLRLRPYLQAQGLDKDEAAEETASSLAATSSSSGTSSEPIDEEEDSPGGGQLHI